MFLEKKSDLLFQVMSVSVTLMREEELIHLFDLELKKK